MRSFNDVSKNGRDRIRQYIFNNIDTPSKELADDLNITQTSIASVKAHLVMKYWLRRDYSRKN